MGAGREIELRQGREKMGSHEKVREEVKRFFISDVNISLKRQSEIGQNKREGSFP